MMLTISKLAREAGLQPDTIRYYERVGLMPKPERGASGYRLYTEEAADRLRFIRGAQRLGLRLRDIRDLLDVIDRGQCPCGHTDAMLKGRLAEIDAEIAALSNLKAQLSRLAGRFSENPASESGSWPCQRELMQIGGR